MCLPPSTCSSAPHFQTTTRCAPTASAYSRLINFLTNAIKHTSAGSITVSVARDTAADGTATIQYIVSDTGTGIPPEEAEKIFERFVKLNDFVQGTGLGLNICHNIATKLGGSVWLDTEYPGNTEGVEHGARFVLAIPDSA